MPYINLTHNSKKHAEEYIKRNWIDSEYTNFFKKQVGARVGHLALTPWSAITGVADTIMGIGAGLASIVTLGKHEPTYKFAIFHLGSTKRIIAESYSSLLKTLNPKIQLTGNRLSDDPHLRLLQSLCMNDYPLIGAGGNGFITDVVSENLRRVARECYNSDNFVKRHIASRLTYSLLAVSSVISRVADGIIGVIAVPLSFITLGKVESINNLAYRALQLTGIVNDIFYCTVKFINPWTGTPRA